MPLEEPHDIRYLHDDGLIKKPQKKTSRFRFFFSKQAVLIEFIIVIFLVSGITIFLSLTKEQDKASIPTQSESDTVEGTVQCNDQPNSQESGCELEVITENNKIYTIEGSATEKTVSELKPGQKVTIVGTIKTLGSELSNTPKEIITVDKVFIQKKSTPTPKQTVHQTDPTPTVSDQQLVVPTPTPQTLKNNTPEPGVEYLTVTYIIDNKDNLANQNVYVQAYLVSGFIGIPGCTSESNCDRSNFILSDFNSPNRDTSYDILLLGGSTDKEGDYAPGQDFFAQAKVITQNESVYLEKIQ